MTNKQQGENYQDFLTELDFEKEFPDLFKQLMVIEKAKWKKSEKKHQELFVLLHGFRHNPDDLDSIADNISDLKEFDEPTILVPINTCVKIVSEFPLITWLVLLTIIFSIGLIAYFIIFNLLAISILAKTVLITIFFIFYLFVLYMFLTRF